MAAGTLARALAGAALFASAAIAPVAADPVADFYTGKTVTLVAAAGAGGGYDAYSRTLTKHLTKHLPGNPSFVVQFMPGAGGVDPEFLAEAKKRRLVIEPMTGEKLQEIVKKTVAASPEVVDRAKKVLEW